MTLSWLLHRIFIFIEFYFYFVFDSKCVHSREKNSIYSEEFLYFSFPNLLKNILKIFQLRFEIKFRILMSIWFFFVKCFQFKTKGGTDEKISENRSVRLISFNSAHHRVTYFNDTFVEPVITLRLQWKSTKIQFRTNYSFCDE